ncbi:MAG: tRNA lysidine(34) synthetase TilS [Actinomycetota bacterium]
MPGQALRRPPAVGRVLERLTATARRHRMFDAGSRVIVAVSGGPDSLCLLHSLVRLRRLLKIDPVCFHFDHRLRKGSELDAVYVRGQAKRLGVPFFLRRAGSAPARGESIEAWARTVRYEALTYLLDELGGGVAAVGHTADDQAETVLLALLRGGGLDALAGMRPVSGSLVRPLLETAREDTEAFCRSLGLRPRRDPMNEDPAFMRPAIRHRVIPQLERATGRNLRATLARTAALLRQDAEFLDQLAEAARPEVIVEEGSRVALLHSGRLADLAPAIAGRIVRRAVLALGSLPESGHVDAVIALARSRPGRSIALPGGLLARREKEYVRLSRPSLRPAR